MWKLLTRFMYLSAGMLVMLAMTVDADTFTAGKDYIAVSPPVVADTGKDKVIVKEFFWYGCPHCYTLEHHVNNWKKPESVEFSVVPAVLGQQWVAHAYTYYTLQALGRLDELHPILFDALHNKKKRLSTLNQLSDFFADHGIEEKKFKSVFNSFAVDTKVKASQNLAKKYDLKSVPIITINGKYITSPSMAGYKRVFEVVNHLVDLETQQPASPDKS